MGNDHEKQSRKRSGGGLRAARGRGLFNFMNIILIGFASCGKSAAAAALGNATSRNCVDLDRVIENRYQQVHGNAASCREIFRKLGAGCFTELETDALNSLRGLRSSILSTGGRAPMSGQNRSLLKSMGTVVYLKCSVNIILKRMKSKGSPASMGSTEEEISAEWNRRDPVYENLADIIIVNDTLTPDETSQAILCKLNN